jgi:hypothetical protein
MAAKLALLAVAFSVMLATSSAFGGLRKLQQVSSSDDLLWRVDRAVTTFSVDSAVSLYQSPHIQ